MVIVYNWEHDKTSLQVMSMQQDQESILMAHLGHIFGAGSLAIRQKVTFPISFADTDHARKEKNSKNLISQAAASSNQTRSSFFFVYFFLAF